MLSLAPFQGITDAVYRNVFHRHFGGISKYYTPFFTGIQKENSKNLREEEIGVRYNDVETVIPQILSHDAEEIIRFARHCKVLGYREINLNMGCPFPRVANKVRGCGMMAEPERTTALLKDVYSSIDIAMSIKCRLGYFEATEIYKFIDCFNVLPIKEIIIHPRLGKQLYTGVADVERFQELIPLINKPLVYNGDITSATGFRVLRTKLSTTKDFMLGRGILTNPFLAEQILGTTEEVDFERLEFFLNDLYNERLQHSGGSPKVLGRMKELWTYMMYLFPDSQGVWRKIKRVKTFEEYEETVGCIFRR